MHATPTDAPTSHSLCKFGICDLHQAQRTWNWAWEQLVGTADGRITQLRLSDAPPKATLCNVLFNPVHKIGFIKAPKTGSDAVLAAMGGLCSEDATLAEVQVRCCCFQFTLLAWSSGRCCAGRCCAAAVHLASLEQRALLCRALLSSCLQRKELIRNKRL